ncbi:MAG TPA: PilX N-terminal domain-containing pilus assembly protein [Methylomirabilota bacterium]|nr:PilX N-terminal domain-containing pilus assembly protein [Methylomirabilota bacterium]
MASRHERVGIPAIRRRSRERGSALIISLMLLLVITILGLALFDLAQIENKSALASLADYRAFELAQAGIERGIRELQNGFINDAYGSESWNDGVSPTCTPACNANTYSTLNIANTTIPAQTVTNFATDPGGTYTVELKLLTVGEANNPVSAGYSYPHGLTCFSPSTKALVDPVPASDVCDNLAFLRSTGTVNGPPGYSRSRTIQVLVRASSTSPFASGITLGGGDGLGNPQLVGQVNFAGSVNILGNVNSNPAIQLVQGSQMWNNWAQMDWTSLTAMRHRQKICPLGTDCTGGTNLVESLETDLRVYGNITNNLVTLQNGSSLGQPGVTACYGPGCPASGRIGKGPLDAIYVADGCPLPCTATAFNLGGGSTLTVDGNNITKPYPFRFPGPPIARTDLAIPTFPDLTSPVTINGVVYPSYQANFWPSHSQNPAMNVATHPNLLPLTVGLTGLVPSFSDAVSWTDVAGNPHSGWICWSDGITGTNTLGFVNGDPPNNYNCGTPDTTLGKYLTPANPMLLNWNGTFNIALPGITYRGAAIWSTRQITLDGGLTAFNDGTGASFCSSHCFPDNHLLVLMSDFSIDIATNGNLNRVMAFIFSNNNLVSSRRQVNIVGTLTAKVNLCFNGAAAGSCSVPAGSGPPQFFQANMYDPRNLPAALFAPSGLSGERWRVTPVPRFWLECRVGPTDTLPTTPSGICSYQ